MTELKNIGTGEAIQILENIWDGIFVVDRNRRIIYWNEGASQITGRPGVTMLNSYCYNNLLAVVDESGNSICQSACPLTHTLTTGEDYQCRVWIKHTSGRSIPLSIRTFALHEHEGRVIGAVEIFQDISTSVGAEQSYQKLVELLSRYTPAFFFREIVGAGNQFPDSSHFAPRRANLIALFYDLTGFVASATKFPPEAALSLLNKLHYQAQTRADQFGGIVEKFTGEGALLLFNQAQAAVDFALALLDEEMVSFNESNSDSGWDKLHMRVTINSGVVLMGVVGDKTRAEATIIGEPVNIASRMLRIKPYRDLLITTTVRDQLLRPEIFNLAISSDPLLGLPQLFARTLP